jgi:hypothetical protein
MFEKQNANKTQWSWAKNCAIVVFYDASVAYFNWKNFNEVQLYEEYNQNAQIAQKEYNLINQGETCNR